MSARPYHKRYHSDALSGFMALTLEERGAYQTLLDMMYDRQGPVLDNDRLLAGYMQVSIRKWRSLRESLIAKRKIYVPSDGLLSNSRVEKELENDAKTSRKLAENGSKGGRKKSENAEKTNENSESDVANQKQKPSLIPESRDQSQKEEAPHAPRKRGGGEGKRLIPKDWQTPVIEDLPPQAKACARQWASGVYARHAEAFLNYWASEGKMKSDWDRAWANRVVALHDQVMRAQRFDGGPVRLAPDMFDRAAAGR